MACKPRPTFEEARTIPCGSCGAPAGSRCIGLGLRDVEWVHAPRAAAYVDTYGPLVPCPSVNYRFNGNALTSHPCVFSEGHHDHCMSEDGDRWVRVREWARRAREEVGA